MKPFYTLFLFSFLLFTKLPAQDCADVRTWINVADDYTYKIDSCQMIRDILTTVLEDCKKQYATDSILGDIYQVLGRVYITCDFNRDTIIDYLETAIRIKEKSKKINSEELARNYINIGIFSNNLRKYTAAINALETGIVHLQNAEFEDKDWLLGYTYKEMGYSFNEIKDHYEGLKYYQAAGKDYSGDPLLFIYEGRSLVHLNKFEEALAKFEEAQQLIKSFEDPIFDDLTNYALTFLEEGILHKKRRNYQLAKDALEQALDLNLNIEPKQYHDIAETYAALIEVSNQLAQPLQARQYFKEGVQMARKETPSEYHALFTELYTNIAVVETSQHNYTAALNSCQKAIIAAVPSFQPTSLADNPILSWQASGSKGELKKALHTKAQTYVSKYESDGQLADYQTALDTYITLDTLVTQIRQSFKAVGSKYFLQQESIPIYENAIQVAFNLYQITNEDYYQEVALARNKAIILLEGLQDKQLKSKNIDSTLLVEERNLLASYYNLPTLIYEASKNQDTILADQLQDSLFATKRAYDLLKKQFEKEYPAYYQHKLNYYPNTSITAMQDKLASNRAVIEFFIGEQNIYTSTITKDQSHIEQIPKPANFEILCDSFINMTRGEYMVEESFSRIAFQLSDLLFSPSNKHLGSINRLILIPDDVLLKMPFDALLTSDYAITGDTWHDKSIPYLFKKYALSQVYASSLLVQEVTQKKVATKDYAGLGIEYWDNTKTDTTTYVDSILQRTQGRLKYSVEEVRVVSNIVEGDTLINKAATKEFIINRGHEYNILHFSTHGVSYEDAPLNSTLVLSKLKDTTDHLLQVADIYTLDLAAKMVVLSACQTLAGPLQRGEGMRTLSRAFSYAGCSSLVASLWNIVDFSTKDVIVDFFKELKAGQPKDVALQQAKIKYLNEVTDINKATPQYWAQMIVIGNTDALYGQKRWMYGLALASFLLVFFLLFRRRKAHRKVVVT